MKHIYFGNGHKYIHKHFLQDAQFNGHNLNHLANSVLKPLMGFKHLSLGDGVVKKDVQSFENPSGSGKKISKLKYKF